MEKGADALPSNGRKIVCLAPIFIDPFEQLSRLSQSNGSFM